MHSVYSRSFSQIVGSNDSSIVTYEALFVLNEISEGNVYTDMLCNENYQQIYVKLLHALMKASNWMAQRIRKVFDNWNISIKSNIKFAINRERMKWRIKFLSIYRINANDSCYFPASGVFKSKGVVLWRWTTSGKRSRTICRGMFAMISARELA